VSSENANKNIALVTRPRTISATVCSGNSVSMMSYEDYGGAAAGVERFSSLQVSVCVS
jgi:hypothetical protein